MSGAGEDPVRLGLVANLARPGGNVTGINKFATELVAKRLELLREMVPAATRVAVLVSPSNAASSDITVRDTAAGARAMGVQVQVLNADTSREIDAAFATLARERPDPLFVDPNPFFVSRRVQLVNLASRLAVPTIYIDRAFAEIGGLMSYGASWYGAKAIMGDDKMVARRGHLVVLRKTHPKQFYFFSGGCWNGRIMYLFCRQNDIVVGGTVQRGNRVRSEYRG